MVLLTSDSKSLFVIATDSSVLVVVLVVVLVEVLDDVLVEVLVEELVEEELVEQSQYDSVVVELVVIAKFFTYI